MINGVHVTELYSLRSDNAAVARHVTCVNIQLRHTYMQVTVRLALIKTVTTIQL